MREDTGRVPALSLVAEDPTGAVVGHVVCTVGSIHKDAALGLAPLGVLPTHQRRGVGQALMHSVLGAADALGFAAVCSLVTSATTPASDSSPRGASGVIPPDPSWAEHFQARALHAWRASLVGSFKYAAPFEDL